MVSAHGDGGRVPDGLAAQAVQQAQVGTENLLQCNTAPYIIRHGNHRPCKNRALTPRQMKNRLFRQRLDGIGSSDRTQKIKSWRIRL